MHDPLMDRAVPQSPPVTFHKGTAVLLKFIYVGDVGQPLANSRSLSEQLVNHLSRLLP